MCVCVVYDYDFFFGDETGHGGSAGAVRDS